MSRRITIDPVTRLEGHGKIEIFLDERGEVENAFLQVAELRGFERFCLGRPAVEMPRITAHICGVCPAAHHIASVKALDALYGVEPPAAARKIRELYYDLFIFEDHALHFYFLGGPDLLVGRGAPPSARNITGVLARLGPELGPRIVSARREAREIMGAIAGRVAHPVFALPGGVSQPLSRELADRVRTAAPRLADFAAFSLDLFAKSVLGSEAWLELLHSEGFRVRAHSMGLADERGQLSFYDGRIRVVDPAGKEKAFFAPSDYPKYIAEHVEPWSYAKFPYLRDPGWRGFTEGERSGLYRVGPLGRLNVAASMATPRAEEHRQQLFAALGGRPVHKTLAFHWARLVEALQAAEAVEALARDPELLSDDVRRLPEAPPRGGVGVVEAPRGTLIHHYQTDEKGLLTMVNLIVASQHNGGSVQISVRKAAKRLIRRGHVDPGILNTLEMAFRAYDPCNACASHALPGELPLEVIIRDASGEVVEVLTRGIEGRA